MFYNFLKEKKMCLDLFKTKAFWVPLSAYQNTTYLIFFNIEALYDMLPKHLNSAHWKLFFGRNPKSPKISHFCEF